MVGLGIEQQYLNLLQDILDNGSTKNTRSGTTIGVFGRTLRHHMKDGFPLFTTRKMNFNNVKVEAIWMLSGNTNIKFLLENDVHIWSADAYRGYLNSGAMFYPDVVAPEGGFKSKKEFVEAFKDQVSRPMTIKEFEHEILNNVIIAEKFGNLGFTYGKAWRNWEGVDQIARLINLLRTDPDNRRMVVSTYNPTVADSLTLPPCHTNWQVWTRELSVEEREKIMSDRGYGYPSTSSRLEQLDHYNIPKRELSISYSMRSVDIPLGQNLHLYGMILLMLADEVGMQPGEVVANFNDAHIYENQIEGVKEMLTRTPFDLPIVTVKNGLKATPDDIQISDYNFQPFIKFPLSVG